MSMTYRHNSQYQSLQIGFAYIGDYTLQFPLHLYPSVVYYHDLFLQALKGGFYCPSEAYSTSDFFSSLTQSGITESILSSRPDSFDLGKSGYDSDTYGSIFRNLSLFDSVLSGRNIVAPTPVSERFCRHLNVSGFVTSRQVPWPRTRHSSTFFGYAFDCDDFLANIPLGLHVDSVNPLGVSTLGYTSTSGYYRNVIDLLNYLVGKTINNFAVVLGYPCSRVLSDLSYSHSLEGLRVKYHSYMFEHNNSFWYEWDSESFIPFVVSKIFGVPALGGDYYSTYTAPTYFSYSGAITSNNLPGPRGLSDDTIVTTGANRVFPLFIARQSVTPLRKYDVSDISNYLGILNRSFATEVNRSWLHFSASSTFSAVEAFKDAEGSLGTNILQDLQKIPGILDALPQIKEGVHVLGRLLKRDLSLSTLKEILDLTTSTNLQASFEWRPFWDLFTRYMPEMISTIHSLGVKSKKVIGYGSFHHTILNECGRKEITLTTRTKLVMDTSSSGLLSAALGIDALGLLPKTSNLWDLIPFTFAVNWFTGIGSAMRRAEYSLLMAFIPAYFVHTYTIMSPLTDSELETLEISSTSSPPASLKLYYRDVSLYSPPIRNSRFGFGIPTEVPFIGTLGSLLYQLIFG